MTTCSNTPEVPASSRTPIHVTAEELAFGGDDPDFFMKPSGAPRPPLVCSVPALRGLLPQCR
ncbi:MAG: hypothetical protein Q4F53_03850 [Nesterenkonia sp.]|nr:hypothetical protein [Nesterenkonia sp.]